MINEELPAGIVPAAGIHIPPDTPPQVDVQLLSSPVSAGLSVGVRVVLDPGEHNFPIGNPPTDVGSEPKVRYNQFSVLIDGVAVVNQPASTTSTDSVTVDVAVVFSSFGDHLLSAIGFSDGGPVSSDPVTVRVHATAPPSFTLTSPADGAVIGLNEAGGLVPVSLTMPAGQFYPVTVTISWDGRSDVEQFTGPGTFQPANPITLSATPLGRRTVTVTVADRDGLGSTLARSVVGRDVAPPTLTVESPQPSDSIKSDDPTGAVIVPMHGTAVDRQSGMVGGQAKVEWALSPTGSRTKAQPVSGTDLSSWTASVLLPGFGAHAIYVWATDQDGNVASPPASGIPVQVVSSFVPKTLEERLGEREYLAALLAFAQAEVTTAAGPPPVQLDTQTLVAVLGQPVDRLSQPSSATADQGTAEVNQLRIPIELLRARIAALKVPPTPGAAGETSYRDTAYAALLSAAGTSYTELRLARGATPKVRQALATRLGIRLSATAPDELDQLIRDSNTLTEAALESLFGLTSTLGGDPLRAHATPLLLTWRLAAAALSWAEQDQHPDQPRTFAVIADPDVIGAADVIPGRTGDPIRTLLAQRQKQLTDYTTLLDTLRKKGADPTAALTAMLTQALPGVDLAALEAQDRQGVDIGSALDVAGLTRGGFRYLRQLAGLAAAGTVTPAEWNDAIAVLTRAHKRSLFPTWQGQEIGFVLSPGFFVRTDTGPSVNPYRVDPRARLDWQTVLRRRGIEGQDLIDANARAVADAEQLALPILRSALLADLAPKITGDPGEELSALFLVDVLAGGRLRTTRLRQGIESVQSLLSDKRSGELQPSHPAFSWKLTHPDSFPAAWSWMGELGTWQAATVAFLFPERNLDPTLLLPHAKPTPMDTLFANIRDIGSFTAETAEQEAARYLAAVLAKPFGSRLTPAAYREALRALTKPLPEPTDGEASWAVPLLLAQRLQASGDFTAALDWYRAVYPYDMAAPVSLYDLINAEKPLRPDLRFPPGFTAALDPFTLVANRSTPYTRYTLICLIRCHLDFADAEFTRETDESVANARTLYGTALRLLGHVALVPQPPLNDTEWPLPIPELDTLRARAIAQLTKIRQGRDIAGFPRVEVQPAALTVTQPTPYRFKVLMDRARQLAGQAAQMEAGYLAALEKYDERNLRIYDALKAIDISAAQVAVATSRVHEAEDAVAAATAQQHKADVLRSTYAALIDAPPNKYEQDLLSDYSQMRDIRDSLANTETAIGIAQTASQAASITGILSSVGTQQEFALAISGMMAVRDFQQHQQDALDAQTQADQLHAGIEQRRQEWQLQQVAAQQDSLVAAAQVVTASDQRTIAGLEQAVAGLQHDQALATLHFLNGQFTNADLYLWMSNTLGSVYRYFLQQSTAIARLAQAQLAFERAEPAQTLIRNDYWQSPSQLTANGAAADRRGLTGAEQLTVDLSRLEDYAFSGQRRRLNLSQTFSLARLMPVEFLDFRRTGTLSFATPTSLFDRDFPGHYLRLVRSVRTSLVALVPSQGIRATLSSNGISRVTTNRNGSFQDVTVRHDPGIVALTSPVSASGVFDLDTQSELLLPFESSGVDTTWDFQLPPAGNPFDFTSIVDLLVTIDYTALYDETYRTQVITRLNADRDRGSDCVFSLSRDFPDQWYDLNNPADPTNRSVTINLRDIDLPVGVQDVTVSQLAVRLDAADPVPDTTISLHRGVTGGDALTHAGITSTRRGNAGAWTPLTGTSPVGDWRISFGADARALFASGRLDDILLAVGWTGTAPAWT